ncbi:MAG: hypothetical protein RIB60_07180 [Phycisphaerales bacterium]
MVTRVIGAVGLLVCSGAAANEVQVVGGETNVVLDTATLSAAASLDLSSVDGDVLTSEKLEGGVAFPITARDAGVLPTTFAYEVGNFLGTFSGTIEHAGEVRFNSDTVVVGDFTIGFDAARAGTLNGAASGFFVESTAGIQAILFDVSAPSTLGATALEATIGADLLVSPEFGAFLFDNGLSASNLAGADVGDALVHASGGCTGLDIDDSGGIHLDDIDAFVADFLAGDARSDFTGDGVLNLDDVQLFVDAFLDCGGTA